MALCNRAARALRIFTLFATVPLLAAGCATGGATSAANAAPVELDGTKWKLIILAGKMDGRVVAFKKKGAGYEALLEEPGPRLQGVPGIHAGAWAFLVRPKGNNEFEGAYRAFASDGSIPEKEVRLFVEGDTMTWDLESATWSKQD